MSRSLLHKTYSVRRGELIAADAKRLSSVALAARQLADNYLLSRGKDRATVGKLLDLIEERGLMLCVRDELLSLRLPETGLAVLPGEYGFKGGAARFCLRRALSPGTSQLSPRDLDLIRSGSGWTERDTEVSVRFMARDFERNQGVEVVPDLKRYFQSRDVSVNEVIWLSGLVTATLISILDTLGQVLRPCFYRPGSLHRAPELRGATLLKMLRLCAEEESLGNAWTIVGVPEEVAFTDFEFALQLEKSMERGEQVGRSFVSVCTEAELLPRCAYEEVTEEFLPLLGRTRPAQKNNFKG